MQMKYVAMSPDVQTFVDGLPSKINTERFWLALSVAAIAVGAAIPTDWFPVRLFFLVGGTLNGILIFFEYVTSLRMRGQWHRAHLHAFKAANGLPLHDHAPQIVVPPTVPAPEPAQVLQGEPVMAKVEGQPNKMVLAEQRPSLEFIRWLYIEGYREPARTVRGEDWIESNTQFKGAGELLRILSIHGWIRDRDGEKRQPGVLVGSADRCIAEFYPELTTVAATVKTTVT